MSKEVPLKVEVNMVHVASPGEISGIWDVDVK